MNNFKKALDKKIIDSLKNNFGVENYDEYRFGKFPSSKNNISNKNENKLIWTIPELKKTIKRIIGYNPINEKYLIKGENFVNPYLKELQRISDNLNKTDFELLISLVAYRILGYKKVKLSRNNSKYWEAINSANKLGDCEDTIDPNFMHFILTKMNLNPIGFDIQFYFSGYGVAVDFMIEQYAYKLKGINVIDAEEGDTVLDLGACWGDTALYFSHKVGDNGKVYSFEFIPENINIFNINIDLNPNLASRIQLIPNPVSNTSEQLIHYKDIGPSSRVELQGFEGQTGTALTISIDDFVSSNSIDKVDFIKMDIEGAEPKALEGAIETIKKFRPKLAIAIYHSMDDFVTIPNWILNLNLDYEIFIGHYTIHAEETICFAKPKELV